MRYWHTCITETNEIEDPVSDGGLVNLDFGLAEKAVADADRTFNTWIEMHKKCNQTKVNLQMQ